MKNSLNRVLTTIGHKEPDKIPLFLLLTMHGAKELHMSIKEYFSKAENVVKGQLLLQEKYNNDCINTTFYGAIDFEAWGGDVRFFEDGPPNSGKPLLKHKEDIKTLNIPIIEESECLNKVVRAIELLKSEVNDEIPIIGLIVSPFSLPIMQMGFKNYIELLYEDRDLFNNLMKINIEFGIEWANTQINAGATAICYFDPMSSPTIIPRELYLETGFKIANDTISKINGPTATHLASGKTLPIIEDIAKTGTVILGVSAMEDLSTVKRACRNKLTILGNLNGIEMCNWTPKQAESIVKETIAQAGQGGGFILSDNHGEIPFQVSEKVLHTIADSLEKWGKYPLDWIGDEGQ